MHAVVSHASTGAAATQVDDFALGQVVHLPSGVLEADAVIHIFKVHEEAFIEQANLVHRFPAQHRAGAGDVFYFRERIVRSVGSEIRTNRLSQKETTSARSPAPCTVTGDNTRYS